MASTVREFLSDSYQLVSASSPTVPLHGNDQSYGLRVLNRLLTSYASTGQLITIGKEFTVPVILGQEFVVCGPADYTPTPDITTGRLANFENAFLTLTGVNYPLINITIAQYNTMWKYQPLQGLPRFIIVFPETDIVRLRIYPKPSQTYDFTVRGKWQLSQLTLNDTLGDLPGYYERYLQLAVAKDLAMYKGRSEAWTQSLEQMLVEARMYMVSSSEIDMSIIGDRESLLNGKWRVMAGI